MAKDKEPKPSRNTPLKPGDTAKGRKVGAPGTRQNPKAVIKDGKKVAEIVDSPHDPKNQ